MIALIYASVIILACTIGSITGMGGGIIIKPVLDFVGFHSVIEISFYSSLALFSMSFTNIYRNKNKLKEADKRIISLLIAGAISGGFIGNRLLNKLLIVFPIESQVVITQSSIMIVLILLTLYLMRINISIKLTSNFFLLLAVGIVLGTVASLLSIGGGPINMAILLFLFSFTIKESALYSIVLIFFSQASTLLTVGFTIGFTKFDNSMFPYIIMAGIIGGLLGSKFSKLFSERTVSILFQLILILVILLNLYNILMAL